MLEGKRILIRRVSILDIQILYRWFNDREIYLLTGSLFYVRSMDGLEKSLLSESQSDFYYIVELKKDRKAIGFVALHHLNWVSRTADFDIIIGEKEYWNKTYGIEIYAVFFDYVFNCLNLRKVSGSILQNNTRSWRLIESFGIHREATLRKQSFFCGKFYDRYIYSIFRKKYKQIENRGKKYLQK